MSELLDQLNFICTVGNIVIFEDTGFIIWDTEEEAELVCIRERLLLVIELLTAN